MLDKKDFFHEIPSEVQEILDKNPDLFDLWNSLTPISKNEWICWITIVKKEETKKEHLNRFCDELRSGKRRPCCWPGCPHRNPKTKKYFSK